MGIGESAHRRRGHTIPAESQCVVRIVAIGVIDPFFFEDDDGKAVTTKAARYQAMLQDFLWPRLRNIDISEVYFQQDGAKAHTAQSTIDVIRTQFEERIISNRGPVNWPPRSCDLTPLDFFLWGYLKDRVYKHRPRTIQDLKNTICEEINGITPAMCAAVVRNFGERMKHCKAALGGHMPEVIFAT